MQNQFTNPYLGLPLDSLTRMQTQIGSLDYNKLKGVRLKGGTITNTVNTLFFKLVREMERRNIAEVTDQEKLEQFVANCVLVLPNEVDMLVYNKIVQPLPEKKGKKK